MNNSPWPARSPLRQPGRLAARPPGPRGLALVGNVLGLLRDPQQQLLVFARRYGSVFQLQVGRQLCLFVGHPDGIQQVLQDRGGRYERWPRDHRSLKALLGQGLLTSDEPTWRRQHRLVQPAFHHYQLGALVGSMAAATAEAASRWEQFALAQQPIDVGAEMSRLALAIVTRALFGLDGGDPGEPLAPGQAERLARALETAIRYTAGELRLPFQLPGPASPRFRAAVEDLDEIVFALIASRQRQPQAGTDLLSLLMQANDDGGAGFSPRELRDEVMTFLIAGHETVANALTWTWHLLAQHPLVAQRLRAEAAQVLGGRAPAYADLPNLGYAASVFKETLRLYPSAWVMARIALADDEIAGWRVPAGSVVIVSPYVTHRLPACWPAPEVFDPGRFSGERGLPPRYAYFPFGGGPHQCIGNHFAQMEAQVILATLAQRYRLEHLPGDTLAPRPAVDMHPRRPLRMRLVAA